MDPDMVTKEELIQMLETAINFEEKAAPLVQEKSLACLEQMKNLEFTETDKMKIREMLQTLVADAEEHRLALEALIRKVRQSPKHEF